MTLVGDGPIAFYLSACTRLVSGFSWPPSEGGKRLDTSSLQLLLASSFWDDNILRPRDRRSLPLDIPSQSGAWPIALVELQSRRFLRVSPSATKARTIMETRPEASQISASKPSSISSTLLNQLRTCCPEAWQRFVNLYGPVIYYWCRQSGLVAEDAADIVQETLLAVMTHLPDFHRDRPGDSFRGWLTTIARNKVREHYRRRQNRPEAVGGSTARCRMAEIPQPSDLSEESSQLAAQSATCLSRRVLETIRAEFENRTWEAFWRVSVGGQSPADVAAELKMSVVAVYKAKSRVLGRFRRVLAELPQ